MAAKKNQILLLLVVTALLANTTLSFAYHAKLPEKDPVARTQKAQDCSNALVVAQARAKRIDIPSRRAEYAALDVIARCTLTAGVNTTIPSTGGSRHQLLRQRYENFKIRQAERMDR